MGVSLPIPELERSLQLAADQTHAFTGLLRRVQDPTLNAVGEWSIGEVATHVSHIFGMYPGLVAGESSPVVDHRTMSSDWQRMLNEDPERDPRAVADRIEDALARFLDAVGSDNWTKPVSWHGGVQVPVYSLASIFMNESGLHGWDVAHAVDEPWTIDAETARHIIWGHLPFLPAFVNKEVVSGMSANFEVRVRGSVPIYFIVAGGEIEIQQEKVSPIHCHISADPVDYLLVGYGRKGQWGPLLMGKIFAWGRKPLLGLKFGQLFQGV